MATPMYVEPPKMVKWLVNHSGGLLKNEKQANIFLVVVALIVIVVSLIFIFDIKVIPAPAIKVLPPEIDPLLK